jgi:Xaa-Pro aminopeptidase
MNSYVEKLASLRAALKHYSLDAYVIQAADPHLSENICDHWQIIRWLTGFTGSAATVIITDNFAGLWTDSRYFLQASKELTGSGFILVQPVSGQVYDYTQWLCENIHSGSKIALDGRLLSVKSFRNIEEKLSVKNIPVISNRDLITPLWTDRPVLPFSTAFDHSLNYSGRDRKEKLADVRNQMRKTGISHHLLTSPDDIMWLLNIRGGDFRFSPLILSFALLGHDQLLLFTDERKIPASISTEFDSLGVVILPYEEVNSLIHSIPRGSVLLISPDKTSVDIYKSIPGSVRIMEDISIPARMKAVKNNTEIANICNCMIRDGVALTRFFHWLEDNSGTIPMSEVSLAVKLKDFRSQQEGYLGSSFNTIIAYNEHAALPHYRPDEETDAVIGEKGILLIDSGGQYLNGTTDITRAIAIGTPTAEQRRDFTLVLKGHISLATAKFPLGTRGYQLDILARKHLWENGLNYGHGTGHGVGYCLNVHEGPQNISPADNRTIIEPGMLISNEPGIYREGEYGIRTENLIICREDEETEFGIFNSFETVSLCYIDKKLIDKSLLDTDEKAWLNQYHSEVLEKLKPFLNENERAWLKDKTESL